MPFRGARISQRGKRCLGELFPPAFASFRQRREVPKDENFLPLRYGRRHALYREKCKFVVVVVSRSPVFRQFPPLCMIRRGRYDGRGRSDSEGLHFPTVLIWRNFRRNLSPISRFFFPGRMSRSWNMYDVWWWGGNPVERKKKQYLGERSTYVRLDGPKKRAYPRDLPSPP